MQTNGRVDAHVGGVNRMPGCAWLSSWCTGRTGHLASPALRLAQVPGSASRTSLVCHELGCGATPSAPRCNLEQMHSDSMAQPQFTQSVLRYDATVCHRIGDKNVGANPSVDMEAAVTAQKNQFLEAISRSSFFLRLRDGGVVDSCRRKTQTRYPC